MTDLATFIDTTATIVTQQVPLQSMTDAVVLVEAYISDIGGWIPDDPSLPNGNGHLANSYTEQQSADAITTTAFNAVYDVAFEVSLTLRVQVAAKLSVGLTLSDAAIAMENEVADFVTARINESDLPLRVETLNTQSTQITETTLSAQSVYGVYNSDTGESTTPDIRVLIQDDVVDTVNKIVDYKATTLRFVRDTYGLDDTWNVVSVYTEPNAPIAIQIRKYIDNDYTTLDTGDTTTYVFNVSPETYQIVSGVILNA